MQSTVALPVSIGVRLSAEQAAKVRPMAAADDRRPSSLIRKMLADALAKWETPEEVATP